MLDYNKIKIGDNIICVDNFDTNLILNEKYIIREIYTSKYYFNGQYFITVNGHNLRFLIFRFKLDLKTIRQTKLKQILNNA